MLPSLKQLLTPNDVKLKQTINEIIIKLESRETDHDVLEKFKSKLKELSDIRSKPSSAYLKRGKTYNKETKVVFCLLFFSLLASVSHLSTLTPRYSVQSIKSNRGGMPTASQAPSLNVTAEQQKVKATPSSQSITSTSSVKAPPKPSNVALPLQVTQKPMGNSAGSQIRLVFLFCPSTYASNFCLLNARTVELVIFNANI